jgi:hypothetical protein
MDNDILTRIESKLDLIINHFHIGQKPVRSLRDLEKEAEAMVIQIREREAKRAKRKANGDKAIQQPSE